MPTICLCDVLCVVHSSFAQRIKQLLALKRILFRIVESWELSPTTNLLRVRAGGHKHILPRRFTAAEKSATATS